MLNLIEYQSLPLLRDKLKRPVEDLSALLPVVNDLFNMVKNSGDTAVRELTIKYDGVDTGNAAVSSNEITEAGRMVSPALKEAIDQAIENISLFHKSQLITGSEIETMPGVICWQKQLPVERVGIYIPGGSAPLFSTILMLAIPASVAGCREIIMCTPPSKNGITDPSLLYAAGRAGVTKIFRVGGIQAIAAMAFGTESIPAVDKIFGPGNQYVTAAKQMASAYGVAIDLPAGPSEVMVVADDSADPVFVASDMLSQAEHGPDSQSVLVTTSRELAGRVSEELESQVKLLPRREIAAESLSHSAIVVAGSRSDIIEILNDYAPEHLILAVNDPREMAGEVRNAGSVFLGNYSPESAGDYASGTNHTLPTNGFARGWSGVGLDSFMKRITFQEISRRGLGDLADTITTMARAENLEGHARAVELRIKKINNESID